MRNRKISAAAYCLLCAFLIMYNHSIAQNIGIGTNNPSSKAKLHIDSDSAGLLIPTLTTAQRTSLSTGSSTPNGLLVYDTDIDHFYYWDESLNGGIGDWHQLVGEADSNFFSRNPALNQIYPRNLSDKLGIGTSNPDDTLDVVGSFENQNGQFALLNKFLAPISAHVLAMNFFDGTNHYRTGILKSNQDTTVAIEYENYVSQHATGFLTSADQSVHHYTLQQSPRIRNAIYVTEDGINTQGKNNLNIDLNMRWNSNDSILATMTNAGNMAIGNHMPENTLDIAGGIRMRDNAQENYIIQSNEFGDMTWVDPAVITDSIGWERNSASGWLYPKSTTDLVAIGKTIPSQTLDVHGTFRSLALNSPATGFSLSNLASGSKMSYDENQDFYSLGLTNSKAYIEYESIDPLDIHTTGFESKNAESKMYYQPPFPDAEISLSITENGVTSIGKNDDANDINMRWNNQSNTLAILMNDGKMGLGKTNPINTLDIEGTFRSLALNSPTTGFSLSNLTTGSKMSYDENQDFYSLGLTSSKVYLEYESIDPFDIHTTGFESKHSESKMYYEPPFPNAEISLSLTENGILTKGKNDDAFAVNMQWNSENDTLVVIKNDGKMGVGTFDPEATIHVDGGIKTDSLQVSDNGTVFVGIQNGTYTVGSSGSAFTTAVLTFPSAFSTPPRVVATVRNEDGVLSNEVFCITTKRISATEVTFNILRVDTSAGWTQNLQIDWIAFN